MPGARKRERRNSRQCELTGRSRYTNSIHLCSILEFAKPLHTWLSHLALTGPAHFRMMKWRHGGVSRLTQLMKPGLDPDILTPRPFPP